MAHIRSEICMARRLDAVRTGTEVDEVQVTFKYLVFRVIALDLDGEQRLLDLAADRLFVREEHVAGELLRYRARALFDLPMLPIRDRRARDAADVDARVAVEAFVFTRDNRVAHDG